MRTLPLQTSIQVTLDANGNGTVQLGPTGSGVSWIVSQVACSTTSTENNPTFDLYNGDPNASNYMGGTYSGNGDSNTGLDTNMMQGSYFTGVWTGGDQGAIGTFTVTGTKSVA